MLSSYKKLIFKRIEVH